jgi:hypothetical protein
MVKKPLAPLFIKFDKIHKFGKKRRGDRLNQEGYLKNYFKNVLSNTKLEDLPFGDAWNILKGKLF